MDIRKAGALMAVMANPATVQAVANGITAMEADNRAVQRAEAQHWVDATAFKGLIMAVIALYVVSILVQSVIPGTITTFSNTSAISGYSTWSAQTTSAWGSLPSIVVVVVVIIFIAIIVAVINML